MLNNVYLGSVVGVLGEIYLEWLLRARRVIYYILKY